MRIRRQLAGSGRPFARESAIERAVLVSAAQRSVHRSHCKAMAGPTNEKVDGAGIWATGAIESRSRSAGGLLLLIPDWLLGTPECADKAVVSVVAVRYLLGVAARRMERLVEQSITRLSKSQINVMARAGH